MPAADILSRQSGVLESHLKQVNMTSSQIIINLVVMAKKIMESDDLSKEMVELATTRKITLPKGFDLSKPTVDGVNPMLPFTRLFVGSTDATGEWVPNEYSFKNFPGAMRHLYKSAEADVHGLTTVLENLTADAGKGKVVRGIEAAKLKDRAVNAKPRKGNGAVRNYIPLAVSKVKPVAVFTAPPELVPVNEDGYALVTVVQVGPGKYGFCFGTAENADITSLIADGYEFHKERLAAAKAQVTVSMDKVASKKSTSTAAV